ncbi:MAG: ABC transporter ATP-binding protein [Anaerolineae bacterium]
MVAPSAGLRAYGRLLFEYLRPERRRVAALTVLLVSGIALQLVNPQLVRRFLDTAQQGGSLRELTLTATAFTAIAVAAQLVRLGAVYLGELVAWSTTNELRSDLALHCLKLDLSFHKRHKPGELIERVDGDVNLLANFMSQLVIQLITNTLLIVGVLVLLWALDWRVGASITGIAVLGVVALSWLNSRVVPLWGELRQASADLFGHLEEWLGGTEDIQTSGASPYVLSRLYPLMRRRWLSMQRAMKMNFFIASLPILVPALAYVAAYVWGAQLYRSEVLTIGSVYVIFYYVDVIKGPLWVIQRQVQDLQTAAASLNRVAQLFDERSDLRDGRIADIGPGAVGLRFDGVTFHYDDDTERPALSDVSFDVAPGTVLGLLGRTGSGKSTVIKLLYRLYDPTSGAIRLHTGGPYPAATETPADASADAGADAAADVGGGVSADGSAGDAVGYREVDLRDLANAAIRKRIGLVTQDVQLFSASLRDNLTVFDDSVDDARIIEAVDSLGLSEWLASMPDGLDTRLASDQRLSAGEAQLLAMARVFIRDADLVVLDEASSRLDPATERRIENAMRALLEGRTAIIIAHRLGTVDKADEIMILDGGRVVEHGRRDELAADAGSRFTRMRRTGLGEELA